MAAKSWQAVMLVERSAGYPVATLERAMRKVVTEDIWFPAVTADGNLDDTSPYVGYVFVTHPAPGGLSRVWCVETVLAGEVSERELFQSLGRTPPLRKGTRVRAISGALKGVEGTVVRMVGTRVTVSIALDSGARTVDLDRTDVECV